MRVLLSMYGSHGDDEPIVGLTVELGAGECDAPVASCVMSRGAWQ
jgi:hypothetical protein